MPVRSPSPTVTSPTDLQSWVDSWHPFLQLLRDRLRFGSGSPEAELYADTGAIYVDGTDDGLGGGIGLWLKSEDDSSVGWRQPQEVVAGGTSRLLDAWVVPPLSSPCGPNTTSIMTTRTVTHHGYPCVAVYRNVVYVQGGAQPYGAGTGIRLDGAYFNAAMSTVLLNTPIPTAQVLKPGVLTGDHVWDAFCFMANNPNSIYPTGWGLLEVFEQS